MSGRVVSEQRITLWQLHPHPQPNTDTPFSLDCLCGLHVRFAYNPYMVYCFKKIGNKRHEQIERNHKASKSLKRKPGWTDSFLKALHSTCHLFFPHYLAIRNNLECLPYTKQTPYITASRHVTFVHFVLFLRVLPCCPQKGWARAKLRMITQQIVPRDTLPSHHISAQSCRKAVSIDGSCLRNRKAVFCTLESEIQVLSFGTEI